VDLHSTLSLKPPVPERRFQHHMALFRLYHPQRPQSLLLGLSTVLMCSQPGAQAPTEANSLTMHRPPDDDLHPLVGQHRGTAPSIALKRLVFYVVDPDAQAASQHFAHTVPPKPSHLSSASLEISPPLQTDR
jgi:hypothetical protein